MLKIPTASIVGMMLHGWNPPKTTFIQQHAPKSLQRTRKLYKDGKVEKLCLVLGSIVDKVIHKLRLKKLRNVFYAGSFTLQQIFQNFMIPSSILLKFQTAMRKFDDRTFIYFRSWKHILIPLYFRLDIYDILLTEWLTVER